MLLSTRINCSTPLLRSIYVRYDSRVRAGARARYTNLRWVCDSSSRRADLLLPGQATLEEDQLMVEVMEYAYGAHTVDWLLLALVVVVLLWLRRQ